MSYVFKHFSEQVSGILVAGYTGRNLIGISYVLGQLYLKAIVVETLRILVLHFRKFQIVCCNYARNGKALYFFEKKTRAVQFVERIGSFQYLVKYY